MRQLLLILFSCMVVISAGAQERPSRESKEGYPKSEQRVNTRSENVRETPSDDSKSSQKKNSRNKKTKTKKVGKRLTVKKLKSGNEIDFYEGEKAIVKTRKDERYKGKIVIINSKEYKIGDSLVVMKDLVLLKRGFGKSLVQKLSGTGLFIGGTAVLAGGVFIGYEGLKVFTLGGPFIIVTAAALTAAIAIDIVGVSIMAEGVKFIVQPTKFKIGKKWFIKA
jgi:hypothetical protein